MVARERCRIPLDGNEVAIYKRSVDKSSSSQVSGQCKCSLLTASLLVKS